MAVYAGRASAQSAWLGHPIPDRHSNIASYGGMFRNIHLVNNGGSLGFTLLVLALMCLIVGVKQWWDDHYSDPDEIF